MVQAIVGFALVVLAVLVALRLQGRLGVL